MIADCRAYYGRRLEEYAQIALKPGEQYRITVTETDKGVHVNVRTIATCVQLYPHFALFRRQSGLATIYECLSYIDIANMLLKEETKHEIMKKLIPEDAPRKIPQGFHMSAKTKEKRTHNGTSRNH